jgi:ferredoxin-nitrate reductase
VWVEADDNRLIRVKGVEDAPANRGRLCPKGGHLWRVIDTPDRVAVPQIRLPAGPLPIWGGNRGGGDLRPVSWDTALDAVARGLRQIMERHGPDAVAFYGSGQLDTEAAYLAAKLFKGHLGTNNTDSNSRLCMASAVAGYVTSLGADGPPTCYADIDHADLILILGANMAEAHPVTFDFIRARKKADPSLQIVVVDPRRTKTAEHADLHVPVALGGDIALLNAIARLLLDAGRLDETFIGEHTNGFEEFAVFLRTLDLDATAAACGLPLGMIRDLATRIGAARAFLSFYSMGANQSTVGVWKNNALINLHLMTGQIGRPGAGPFSLTGQPNAMGGREAGLLSHQLPGYRFVADPEHRAEMEAAWGLPSGKISPKPGLSAVEMFRALEQGRLKAVWIAATNPAVSLPDLHATRRALERAELVIVQDCYHPTETTRYAHVLLPAAQFSEKEGTSTNSERMVSFSEKIVEPPGVAWPDWKIIAGVGERLGFSGFEFSAAGEVWDEFRRLTAGRPCDMSGMTAARLRRERQLQWPCPAEDHPGTPRRYTDHIFPTEDGRARFWPRPHLAPRELPDHEFPLVLTTGRLAPHWHTRTRTGKVKQLVKMAPEPVVEVHPDDAARRGIEEGDLVLVSSRRGCVRIRAKVIDTVSPGSLFAAFHWGDMFAAETGINYLTLPATDPISKQPEFKFCAVALERAPVELPPDRDPERAGRGSDEEFGPGAEHGPAWLPEETMAAGHWWQARR